MMDSHNVSRDRESVVKALNKIKAKALVIGIESDILFPIHEQKFLAQQIPRATFTALTSIYGHDGFLVEFDQLKKIIRHHFKKLYSKVLV
jgi:homoserine O-acetyltransferase